jgi:hypothetical protein
MRLIVILFLSFSWMGCMTPVRAVGDLAKSAATTTVTATKAGGIMLKDAAQGTYNAAGNAWKQASAGRSPEILPPSAIP